jgi:hypothetical protein
MPMTRIYKMINPFKKKEQETQQLFVNLTNKPT